MFRVRISDHRTEQVASLKDVHMSDATFGMWFGLAHDDSPIILRNSGIQEIFALEWEAP